MDMQQLLAAAQQMQNHLMNAQRELADTEVEGSSGGGLVRVRVDGQGEVVDVTISPDVIGDDDPADTVQAIADLVMAAVRDAYRRVSDLQQEKMGPLAAELGGGMRGVPPGAGGPGGGPGGGLGLPGLGELFGGTSGAAGDEPSGPGS